MKRLNWKNKADYKKDLFVKVPRGNAKYLMKSVFV